MTDSKRTRVLEDSDTESDVEDCELDPEALEADAVVAAYLANGEGATQPNNGLGITSLANHMANIGGQQHAVCIGSMLGVAAGVMLAKTQSCTEYRALNPRQAGKRGTRSPSKLGSVGKKSKHVEEEVEEVAGGDSEAEEEEVVEEDEYGEPIAALPSTPVSAIYILTDGSIVGAAGSAMAGFEGLPWSYNPHAEDVLQYVCPSLLGAPDMVASGEEDQEDKQGKDSEESEQESGEETSDDGEDEEEKA